MKYSALPLALLLACDTAVVAQDGKAAPAADGQPAVAVKATIEAEALDLESIHFLVKKGKVKDAAALEKQINDPKEKLNNVDADADGKVDKIQIVEIKKDNGGSTFELKAIPSKSKDKDAAVVVAVIHFDPDKTAGKLIVKAEFTPVVISADTFLFIHETAITVQGDTIVLVEPNPFFSWFFVVNRPVFVGVFVYDVSPRIIIKGKRWHKHKHKHKGKWKGKGHW
jgi:hypothetical protein